MNTLQAMADEASSVRPQIRVYFVAEKVDGGLEHGRSGYGVRVQVFGTQTHVDLGGDNKALWGAAVENANEGGLLKKSGFAQNKQQELPQRQADSDKATLAANIKQTTPPEQPTDLPGTPTAGGKNNLVDADESRKLSHSEGDAAETKLAPELVITYPADDKNRKQKQLHLKRKTEDAKAKDSLFSQFKGIPMTPEDGDEPSRFLGRIDIYEANQRILSREDLETYPRRFFFNYARPIDADGVADSENWPGLQMDDLAVIARGYLLATVMVLRAGLRETLTTLEKAVPEPESAQAR